jgi:hypothetical protein
MSKKHSSRFFRTYFASPDRTESETPDIVPRSIPGGPPGRTETVTASGDTAIADAEDTAQGVVDRSLALVDSEDVNGHGPALDLGAETR